MLLMASGASPGERSDATRILLKCVSREAWKSRTTDEFSTNRPRTHISHQLGKAPGTFRCRADRIRGAFSQR